MCNIFLVYVVILCCIELEVVLCDIFKYIQRRGSRGELCPLIFNCYTVHFIWYLLKAKLFSIKGCTDRPLVRPYVTNSLIWPCRKHLVIYFYGNFCKIYNHYQKVRLFITCLYLKPLIIFLYMK